MNPFQHIQNLDNQITAMERELKYSKNRQKDLNRINTLISARNCFESMLRGKYFTEVVEILILDKMLSVYDNFRIREGGDINSAEIDLMGAFDNMFSMGVKARRMAVDEALRMYLDFHAKQDGTWSDDKSDEEKKAYLTTRDDLIATKLTERLTKIKSLIKFRHHERVTS